MRSVFTWAFVALVMWVFIDAALSINFYETEQQLRRNAELRERAR